MNLLIIWFVLFWIFVKNKFEGEILGLDVYDTESSEWYKFSSI